MLTTRQIELLKYLEKREEYTTTKELAEEFSISSRTIRNDLDAIEYSTKDLPIKIERTPRLGIRLEFLEKVGLDSILYTNDMKEYSRDERAVNHTYYQAILDNIEKYGGYFYLGKGICMPHARTEDGAIKSEMCVLMVKNKVRFFNNQVRVFITIAAKGEMEHFKNLHRIANFCNDEEKMKRLEEIKDEKELLELIGE